MWGVFQTKKKKYPKILEKLKGKRIIAWMENDFFVLWKGGVKFSSFFHNALFLLEFNNLRTIIDLISVISYIRRCFF